MYLNNLLSFSIRLALLHKSKTLWDPVGCHLSSGHKLLTVTQQLSKHSLKIDKNYQCNWNLTILNHLCTSLSKGTCSTSGKWIIPSIIKASKKPEIGCSLPIYRGQFIFIQFSTNIWSIYKISFSTFLRLCGKLVIQYTKF